LNQNPTFWEKVEPKPYFWEKYNKTQPYFWEKYNKTQPYFWEKYNKTQPYFWEKYNKTQPYFWEKSSANEVEKTEPKKTTFWFNLLEKGCLLVQPFRKRLSFGSTF